MTVRVLSLNAGLITIAVLTAVTGFIAPPLGAQENGLIEADAAENNFYIKPDFDGSSVVIFGAVDRAKVASDAFDIAITVRGPVNAVTVWKKAPLGALWINSKKQIFDAAPSFYAVLGTTPIADMAPFEERRDFELGLDTIRLETDANARRLGEPAGQGFRVALLKAKTAGGLYLESVKDIARLGKSLFRAKFFVPPAAGPGLYRVKVFLIQGGKIRSSSPSYVRIEKAGVEQLLAATSTGQPWVYGVVAVTIAAIVGGLASLLFRRT